MGGAPDDIIHATAIALGSHGALICGPSGSGKSDLALRCVMQPATPLIPQSATLVSDDRVVLKKNNGALMASPPDQIAGLLEVRGVGLFRLPVAHNATVRLIVELVDSKHIERLPDPTAATEVMGVSVPVIRLAAFEASAPSKLLLALSENERLPD